MKPRNDRGSVMLEFILVMPILLFLILAIAQFSMIWIARQITYYAAYNATRAAVVYNPEDYYGFTNTGNKFFSDKGPVYKAAYRVISFLNFKNEVALNMRDAFWEDVSNSTEQSNPNVAKNPWGNLDKLVQIYGSSFPELKITHRETMEHDDANAIQVTVLFKFPLDIPMVGRIISKFDELNEYKEDTSGEYDTLSGYNFSKENSDKVKNPREFNYIRIFATCILPKPVDTSQYPRISNTDTNLSGLGGSLSGAFQQRISTF